MSMAETQTDHGYEDPKERKSDHGTKIAGKVILSYCVNEFRGCQKAACA